MGEMELPHDYYARSYQVPFWKAMEGPKGKKRGCLVWHRRSGKDLTALNFTGTKMYERVGTYYHCFPEYNQGRKVMWDGMDGQGKKFTDHFPKELRRRTNNTEMKIEMSNGSIWQIIGADNFNSVVGANPVGIVFSEWAISDAYPAAWDYFRPMLVENGGWALFIYTPRGRNHGFSLYQMALTNPDWFCQLLSVDDTNVISRADIQAERDAGMSEDMIQQEFYCSFVASTEAVVIPFELINASLRREVYYPRSPKIAGLDPARFGNDRTALVVRRGGEITHVETWGKTDTVVTTARVIDRYRAKHFDAIAVDAIGIGAGIADSLKHQGIPTAMVQVSEKPVNEERFKTQRDELWWKLREWFEEGSCNLGRGLMPQQQAALMKDIQDIRYDYSPTGKIKIESKEDMKERLGFSPDIGDALCLTFTHKITQRVRNDGDNRRRPGISNFDARRGKRDMGDYQEYFAP